MPGSFTGNDRYFVDDLNFLIEPQTAFDVGIGAGKIGQLIQSHAPDCRTIGFEAWKPFINAAVLPYYEHIHNVDFKRWLRRKHDWFVDLVVFGDVLEHLRHSEAMDILDACNYRAKWMAIFTPLSMIQGVVEDNPFSAHQSIITLSDLNRYNVVHYFKNLENNIYYCLLRGICT